MKTIENKKKKTRQSSQDLTERKRAQEKEKEVAAMKMMADTIKAIGDGVILVDMDGKITDVNPAWEKMTGYEHSEVIGKDAAEVAQKMHKPEDVEKPISVLRTAMGGKVPTPLIYTLIRKDGQEIPLTYTLSFMRDAAGKPTQIVGVVKDLTEIKKTEEELRESEEKFRKIFDSANDALIYLDRSGRILDVNRKAVQVFGGPKKELVGRHFTKVSILSPRDIIELMNVFQKLLAGKKSVGIHIKNKKGQEFYLECSISLVKTNHKAGSVTVIARDITERKKAERALLEEKNKLQTYLDVAGIIILILSAKNKVLFINKKGSELLGYKGMEILGKDWFTNFIPEKNRVETKDVFGKLINEERNRTEYFESSVSTKGGEERIITWHNVLLKDEQGKPQAVLVTGADITELKEAKLTIEQLRALDKMKDDFLNIAAHELRTPLTSIIGLSEIIKEQKPSLAPPYPKYINIICNESIRLGHIIKRMLTVTRFESGRETVRVEPFNLVTFVPSLLPNLNILAKKKKSRIVTNIEKKNIVIRSDKEKISQVIYNFVDNAIKYGPEAQTIVISATKPEKDWVKIEVTDQGPGIPPSLQKRLFTQFSQLEFSLSRSQEGTGLGLYICKLIVDMLGGKIGVKSVLGKGSTFYFTLPTKKTSKSPPPQNKTNSFLRKK